MLLLTYLVLISSNAELFTDDSCFDWAGVPREKMAQKCFRFSFFCFISFKKFIHNGHPRNMSKTVFL